MDILLRHGLSERVPQQVQAYRDGRDAAYSRLQKDIKVKEEAIAKELDQDKEGLQTAVESYIAEVAFLGWK